MYKNHQEIGMHQTRLMISTVEIRMPHMVQLRESLDNSVILQTSWWKWMNAYFNWADPIPWAAQCAQLPHYHTKAENVTFFWEGFVPYELRGHPFWCASRGVISHRTICHRSRKAKVTYLDSPILVHQTVGTFQVPVNYLHAVYAHQSPFTK